ncbi:UDP-3-O-(3-hydroxymyristoyl)glucosamine N-acyltransferase [Piscinibacter sakaiensis]|uniref:UDP-3-O-(3-hydroxymyristoyl)glucosamine N-acyltransferase n=1 Tax=Piscinibacter sakaiensis TaxID=1547922 RepID=UPI003AAA5548
MTASHALGEIVAALAAQQRGAPAAELVGDAELRITRIGPLDGADSSTLSFLSNPRYRSQLAQTAAACVIVAPALADEAAARGAIIRCDDPYLYFAHLTQWWARQARPSFVTGIHPSAVVDPSADIDPAAAVGPLAVIEAGAVVAAGASIGAHCFIGADARIGESTRLAARVTVATGCSIGARGIVHSGAVIGADGFGFAPARDGHWEKIEQLGAVRIGDDVEIGANTCIDRGALDDTVIGDGVKLDNLVQIGHNVIVGAHCAMAGCVGVAGSAVIGAHCSIGGGAIVLGHLQLAEHVVISAATVVTRSIKQPGLYSGVFPIDDNASWEKNAATLRQLHGLRDRLRALEQRARPAQDEQQP